MKVTCSECGKTYEVKDQYQGRQVRCKCGASIQVPSGAAEPFRESTVLTPVTKLLDFMIGKLRFAQQSPKAFDSYSRSVAVLGAYVVLVAGALFFLQSCVLAIRVDSLSLLLRGTYGMLAACILHYIAAKFAVSGTRLVRNYQYVISSQSLLDCMGLLALAFSVVLLTRGIVDAIQIGDFSPLLLMFTGVLLLV
jgi:hypothetical protein